MKKRKIKFTDKKHSRNGILSTILGAVSAGLLFCLLAAAYLTSGQAGKAVAVLGLLAFFVACAGAWYGVLGRRDEDSYRLFPDLGIGINGLLLVGFVMIYIMGW